jgi:Hint module
MEMRLIMFPVLSLAVLLASPLLGGCFAGAVQNNANIIYPSKRYTVYSDISGTVKSSADQLGYSECSWNRFTQDVDQLAYETIKTNMASKLSHVQNLLDGSSETQWEPSWDCWVNHYEDYTWAELASSNVQGYFLTLGWTESLWGGSDSPPSEDKEWDGLSADERNAASEVCYLESTWDEEQGLGECDDTGGGGSGVCFSSRNKVHVRGKGLVPVSSLQIGDFVLAGGGKFSRIYSFSHLDHRRPAEYLQISMTGVPEPLEISELHMLWVNNKMARAATAKEGDVVFYKERKVVIEKIKMVHRIGAFAPVTESGDILVGGVLCSCFVAILDHSPISQHFATHAFLSPVRLLCSFSFTACEQESYYDGYSTWIYAMMTLVEFVNTFTASVRIIALLVALPVFLAVYLAVEMILSFASFGWAAVGTAVLYMHTKG